MAEKIVHILSQNIFFSQIIFLTVYLIIYYEKECFIFCGV